MEEDGKIRTDITSSPPSTSSLGERENGYDRYNEIDESQDSQSEDNSSQDNFSEIYEEHVKKHEPIENKVATAPIEIKIEINDKPNLNQVNEEPRNVFNTAGYKKNIQNHYKFKTLHKLQEKQFSKLRLV